MLGIQTHPHPLVFFFFFPLSDHNHQVDYFCRFMVRAGYVRVAVIHRTLTWTIGYLSYAQMLMHAIAHQGVRAPYESLHENSTLGGKSLAAPGNRTWVSGVPVRCSNPLSYIPSSSKLQFNRPIDHFYNLLTLFILLTYFVVAIL